MKNVLGGTCDEAFEFSLLVLMHRQFDE